MITWVSAATTHYSMDMRRLLKSFSILGNGHISNFMSLLDEKWYHTIKFKILRSILPNITTSHVFWIDADCEFLQDIPVENLTQKPLTAVRHFFLNNTPSWGPYKHRLLKNVDGHYWQACVFGGEVSAIGRMIESLRWMDEENETFDEYGLCVYWSNNYRRVQTLPCCYAKPAKFQSSEWEASYRERAGGQEVIVHHNRALFPMKI